MNFELIILNLSEANGALFQSKARVIPVFGNRYCGLHIDW
ncbi:hypothetical protein COO91_10915 (plasmid) [Nostoc flagelliforme CCNUN1]|uniref:Uncharacterized protein n=1 Tax=Nostoc flagelliforme CCNUN1 TaxID=2038116 RepID=A0A2K8TAF6_9NOSO|nr:hypothetical protein COO91_10915 [Nostoc flagelliforme CCNUN1]